MFSNFLFRSIVLISFITILGCAQTSQKQAGQEDVSSVPAKLRSSCSAETSSSSDRGCPYAKEKQAEAKKNCGCSKK